MAALDQLARLVMPLPLGLNLWKVQNTYWELLQKLPQQARDEFQKAPENAQTWNQHFLDLGRTLGFALTGLAAANAPANLAACLISARG